MANRLAYERGRQRFCVVKDLRSTRIPEELCILTILYTCSCQTDLIIKTCAKYAFISVINYFIMAMSGRGSL